MKRHLLASMIALAGSCAIAQTPDVPPLNLALPSSAADSSYAADPPGTYYGDVDGAQRDANGVQMSGALSTTIGYAKGYGTGISNSAELNVSKQTDDGQTFDLHLRVTEGDALPYQRRYYRRGW